MYVLGVCDDSECALFVCVVVYVLGVCDDSECAFDYDKHKP